MHPALLLKKYLQLHIRLLPFGARNKKLNFFKNFSVRRLFWISKTLATLIKSLQMIVFCLTVGQNNFQNKISFLNCRHKFLLTISVHRRKSNWRMKSNWYSHHYFCRKIGILGPSLRLYQLSTKPMQISSFCWNKEILIHCLMWYFGYFLGYLLGSIQKFISDAAWENFISPNSQPYN